MGYNPQESLENTISTIGTLLGGTPNYCPLTIPSLPKLSKNLTWICDLKMLKEKVNQKIIPTGGERC